MDWFCFSCRLGRLFWFDMPGSTVVLNVVYAERCDLSEYCGVGYLVVIVGLVGI